MQSYTGVGETVEGLGVDVWREVGVGRPGSCRNGVSELTAKDFALLDSEMGKRVEIQAKLLASTSTRIRDKRRFMRA